MLKYALIRLSFLWLSLILLLGATLIIAPYLPSKGTLLLTHNVFLNRYDRFEFYDISRGLSYGFTPSLGEDVISASLAPNGRYVAIVSIENGQYTLKITTLAGQLISETSTLLGMWSPDSRYIIYEDGNSKIFVYNVELQSVTQVTHDTLSAFMPSWSFDSQHIVFVSSNSDDETSQIWLADINENNLRPILDSDASIQCPIWSPNGEVIAYFEILEDGRQLQYINVDGTVNDSYPTGIWRTLSCPSWSVDGRYIAFMAFLTQEYTTYIVLLDTITGETVSIMEVDQTTAVRWWR